ncbi:hypothetical protein [Paenibacillus tyrfis]|uniref:hypothetical protein n=1 Tax=Paenibacillus tyrfis TaxID=1501230 RepID=UPI000B595100|nr:hypothetical protein [Paenibacillus tyrfis]
MSKRFEESIERLQEYAREHGWPTVQQWNSFAKKQGLLQTGAILRFTKKSWRQICEQYGFPFTFNRYTKNDCIAAIIEAASVVGSSLTKIQYEEFRKGKDLPSISNINTLCTGWNAAKREAGLEENQTAKMPYTDEELLGALSAAAKDLGEKFSYLQYQEWNNGEYPHYLSILNRYGSIEEAKKRRDLPSFKVGGQEKYPDGYWKEALKKFVIQNISRDDYEAWARKNTAPSVQVIYDDKGSYEAAVLEILLEHVEYLKRKRGDAPLDLIGASAFAEMLGTSHQNVNRAGKLSLNPKYRGSFLHPDAVFEGRPLWIRGKAEKFAAARRGTTYHDE